MEERLKQSIRSVPDFPKPGILFRDITPVLADPALFRDTIEELAAPFRNDRISKVLGIESRGFLFGPPLALQLGAGFVPARKRGKLPRETIRETYALEYGTDSLEIHRDSFASGEKVLIVDDLLATGGTASGAARLVEKVGAEVVGAAFVVELKFLDGRAKLADRRVHVLVRY
jgi:adenine phosphoribosyltransferase